jgi:hypothetical protein
MKTIAQKHYKVPLYVAMILSICLLPATAKAIPTLPISASATFVFGLDETVSLDVLVNADGSNFRYDYTLTNLGSADLTLLYVRLGYGYEGPSTVVDYDLPGTNTEVVKPAFYPFLVGSFGVNLNPLMNSTDSISWYVTYDGFLSHQNVALGASFKGELTPSNQDLTYTAQTSPVPEPATLLLIGLGVLGGVIVPKKRKS